MITKESNINPVNSKLAESEKIINSFRFVGLGHIDLLVAEGLHGNRTAIRNQLNTHSDAVKQVVARKMLVLGPQHFGADDLRAVQSTKQTLHSRVLGLATIASIEVLGAQASPPVKAALASRLR